MQSNCRGGCPFDKLARDLNALSGDSDAFFDGCDEDVCYETLEELAESEGIEVSDIIDYLEDGRELFSAIDEVCQDQFEAALEDYLDAEAEDGICWDDDYEDWEENDTWSESGLDSCAEYEDTCHVFGVHFDGINNACDFFNVDENLVRYAIKNGLTLDEAMLRVLKISEAGYDLR